MWGEKEDTIVNPEKLENTLESFPDLGSKKEKGTEIQPTITYSIADLFSKNKHKKNKKDTVAPGWVRLYYNKNRKSCKESGPYTKTTELEYDHLRVKILTNLYIREELKEEEDELNNYRNEYIHYWIEEYKEIPDDWESETEDEYFSSDYEEDYDDDDNYDDYIN